jgi:hypothetical protein
MTRVGLSMVFARAHLIWLLLVVSSGALACGVVSGQVGVRAVGPGGEIALEDGRRARLGGLRLAPGADAALAKAGPPRFGLVLIARNPDRWGRFVVDLQDQGGQSLALDLLARGLATVRPEPEARPCEPERLEAEGAAREAGEGLWSEPGAVLDAGDGAALAEADGRFALVEGVVRRVGEGRSRVYLDFAGKSGFSVMVARKIEPQFRRAGVDLATLAGQRVRIRGVMDVRFGPRMEIADPLMIELLERAKETGRGG